jgi:transposase
MIAEMQRLKELGLSNKKICGALGISKNTLKKYLKNEWDQNKSSTSVYTPPWSSKIDWGDVHSKTSDGMAVNHYWEEYVTEENPEVTSISFWREYKRRYPKVDVHYHKIHPPGERCEIDYKGAKGAEVLGYLDQESKLFVPCRLYGAVLCFSQKLFVRATHYEKQADWLESTGKAYEYFGGVPGTTAVDNAKALVSKASRYDADINPELIRFAKHYDTAPIAMRPGKPKDKNIIENALGVFWRWIRFRISKKRFQSLAELNAYLLKELEVFNNRIQKKYGLSRNEKFDRAEKSKLRPLPDAAYDCGEWRVAKVHPDCHIQVKKNYYSVPFQYVGKEVDVRFTNGLVEVFFNTERLTCHHRRSHQTSAKYVTNPKHWPPKFHDISNSTPEYCLKKAEAIGDATGKVVRRLINEAIHPLQHLRRIQGILRLAGRYSGKKLEQSCHFFQSRNLSEIRIQNIEAVIKKNGSEAKKKQATVKRQSNDNLRGQKHWANNLLH